MYSKGDCCDPILAAHFAEDIGQMVRDSFLAQSYFAGNLAVRHSTGK
jgi:hypothetical protein